MQMSSRKLLAFDLDGTLVSSDYQINPRTLSAVQQARAAGHAVTVITGRVTASARQYLEQLGIDTAFGTAQGACVHHEDGGLLRDVRMPHATLLEVVQQFGAEAVEFFVPHGEAVFVRDPDSKRSDGTEYWAWIKAEARGVQAIHALPREDVYKISIHHDALHSFEPRVRAAFPHLRFYPWGGKYLEVAHEDASARQLDRHMPARDRAIAENERTRGVSADLYRPLEWNLTPLVRTGDHHQLERNARTGPAPPVGRPTCRG